ncbi:MAG TPA: hypothetical protein VFG54_13980 [Prolixibacteraceae bacterium]|nr:hypothetical protein [Prolixibacteraceae bacterium]
MARVKKYLGDMVSGKAGNLVFFRLNGETYVRGIQKRQSDSWTPAQQLHRKRMGQVSGLWRKIRYSQIPGIWNHGDQKMNGYALFVKANMPAFATDGSLVDARELKLSIGHLALPQEFRAERQEPTQPLIRVTWENKSQPKGERLEDELMVISATGEAYTDVMATGIRRKDREGVFELPGINVPITHVYLFFASRDRNEYTESVCFEV